MTDPLRTDVPHGARIWNYWLGGKDNYAADRQIGDAVVAAFPGFVECARQSRQFLIRAVTHLAGEAGVDQFLDVGTGLPTAQNTHQVAQQVRPESTVVYVDNDPLVLAHARALLNDTSPEGATDYLDHDYRDPAGLIERARGFLDFDRPIAALFMGVFGYVEAAEMHRIVRTVVDALPAGSYLAMWDGTDLTEEMRAASAAQAELGSPYRLSSVAELQECYAGLEMIEPGLVPVTLWRPDPGHLRAPQPIDAHGGIGRRP